MASATRAPATSGGRPTGQQRPTPAPPQPAPVSTSPGARAAARGGPPAVSLGARVAPDELDLSSGELRIPEATAAAVEPGKELEVRVRLPRLAEGTLRLRKQGAAFATAGAQAILLRHPALARLAEVSPTVLALTVKENRVSGLVGLGTPGPARGDGRALAAAMARAPELLGWAGLSSLRVPTVRNRFEDGVIDLAVENLGFTLGGFLSGTASVALDNRELSFDGSAKISVPGGSSGELLVKKAPTGELAGRLEILVALGSVVGTVVATLSRGFVSIMGQVGYTSDRLSGKVTLVATDEPTARDLTLKKPEAGGEVPIELPGPERPARPGPRAFCGFGQLTFRVTDWLAGTATVIVNSRGQATIVGEIAPPKEFILFEQKEWVRKIFKLEVKAGYGIPVVGQVGLFASIGLDAIAKVGPGKLYALKLSGAYSTDPRVAKSLAIEGTLNISAFAGLRLRAEGGLVVTILGHDIKAGAGLNALAGVRGYVEATPRIGMRELAPGGKREYFIQGHLELAAQPVLGFSGDLFVAIETPWWSPLSDKRWTWPLFSIEYPLPGEFGIGADVDYVLGSRRWPSIQFGEVSFDGSKFMTDVMNDNTDSGGGKEEKKPADWEEGPGAVGPGGARTRGGKLKKPGEPGADPDPVGEPVPFTDGKSSHRLWYAEKPGSAQLLVASEEEPADAKLARLAGQIPDLLEGDRAGATLLLERARQLLPRMKDESQRVAVMKEAERRAEETYRKHGKDKGRKRTPKPNRKDENKKLKSDEHRLAELLTHLFSLMRMEPWRPLQEEASWAARLRGKGVAGKEPVEVTAAGKRPKATIAARTGVTALDAARGGQLATTFNPAGRDRVGRARDVVVQELNGIARIPIAGAEIQVRARTALEAHLKRIAAEVADTGKALKVTSLARARSIHEMEPPWPVVFNVRATPNKGYQDNFRREMEQQLHEQQQQLNTLSVDHWVARLDTYRSKYTRLFESLDQNARRAVARELQARLAEARQIAADEEQALDDASRRLQDLCNATGGKQTAEIAAARAELETLEARAAIRESPQAVAARLRLERYLATHADVTRLTRWQTRRLLQLSREARAVGRSGQEKAFQRLHAEGLSELALSQGRAGLWDGLKFWHAKVYALLHNPDQVAGGHGTIADLTPVKRPAKPTNPADLDDVARYQAEEKAWVEYQQRLARFAGHSWINSIIGGSWGARLPGLRKEITGSPNYTPETYGLWRMGLRLDYAPR